MRAATTIGMVPLSSERRRPALTSMALVAFLVLSTTGCSETTGPESLRLERYSGQGQERGITLELLDSLRIRVTDDGGEPRDGVPVDWAVRAGGGTVTVVDSATNSDGVARAVWTLGPEVGEQEVVASAPDAEAVTFSAIGTPGVVFVAVWRGLDPELQDSLPSDTMRIHAVRDTFIREARAGLEQGGDDLHVGGSIGLGATLDPNWPFHFDPGRVHVTPGAVFTFPECLEGPLLTGEAVAAQLEEGGGCYNPDDLYLERLDPVPEWYLEEMAAG